MSIPKNGLRLVNGTYYSMEQEIDPEFEVNVTSARVVRPTALWIRPRWNSNPVLQFFVHSSEPSILGLLYMKCFKWGANEGRHTFKKREEGVQFECVCLSVSAGSLLIQPYLY